MHLVRSSDTTYPHRVSVAEGSPGEDRNVSDVEASAGNFAGMAVALGLFIDL